MDYEFEIEMLLRLWDFWDSGTRAEVIPRILAHGGIDAMILTAHLVDNLATDDPGSQDVFLTALHDARRAEADDPTKASSSEPPK